MYTACLRQTFVVCRTLLCTSLVSSISFRLRAHTEKTKPQNDSETSKIILNSVNWAHITLKTKAISDWKVTPNSSHKLYSVWIPYFAPQKSLLVLWIRDLCFHPSSVPVTQRPFRHWAPCAHLTPNHRRVNFFASFKGISVVCGNSLFQSQVCNGINNKNSSETNFPLQSCYE